MDEHRLHVERRQLTDYPREDHADRWRVFVLKVVGPIDFQQHRRVDRQSFALPHDAVLPEELDRLVAGAMNPDLAVLHDAEAILEADDRAVVEAEQIAEKARRAGVAVQRTGEAVRDAKCALELRQPQRGRQRGEREVGLRRLEHRVIVVGNRLRGGWRRRGRRVLRRRTSGPADRQDRRKHHTRRHTRHGRPSTQARCRARPEFFVGNARNHEAGLLRP